MEAAADRYFIRHSVYDRSGIFERSPSAWPATESIVRHAVDHGPNAAEHKTVIHATHETTEAVVREAVNGMTADRHLIDEPQVIRINRAG
jgi:hypothetical protein